MGVYATGTPNDGINRPLIARSRSGSISPLIRRNTEFRICRLMPSSYLRDNSSLNGRNHTCTEFIMAIDESRPERLDGMSAERVSLSRWVNESLPSCQEILTSHDVARLTRRPQWVLAALALLGRFPSKQRFHGRRVGWRRRDVLRWISADGSADSPAPGTRQESQIPPQRELDLRHPPGRRCGSARPRCSSVPHKRPDELRWQGSRAFRPIVSRSGFPSRGESTSR